MFAVLLVLSVVCVLGLLWWRSHVLARRKAPRSGSVSMLVVAGSGGHTSEILSLMRALISTRSHYSPRIYLVSKTDVTSETRIHSMEQQLKVTDARHSQYCVLRIPRSREVHQSWLSTVLTTAYSLAYSVPLIFQRKPDVILCNGPGTCVPICLVAFVFRLLGIVDTELVYVESICRVEDLSLSGKILYRVAKHFVVQWPELCLKYKRASYLGLLS